MSCCDSLKAELELSLFLLLLVASGRRQSMDNKMPPTCSVAASQLAGSPSLGHILADQAALYATVSHPKAKAISKPLMSLDSFKVSPVSAHSCHKRHRTTFSQFQLGILEESFKQNNYPSPAFRDALASRTSLDSSRVQVWFQNRRAKHKKQLSQAMRCFVANASGGSTTISADATTNSAADHTITQQVAGAATIHHHHQHHHQQQAAAVVTQCAAQLQQQMALGLHLNNMQHQHQQHQQQQQQQQHQQQQQQHLRNDMLANMTANNQMDRDTSYQRAPIYTQVKEEVTLPSCVSKSPLEYAAAAAAAAAAANLQAASTTPTIITTSAANSSGSPMQNFLYSQHCWPFGALMQANQQQQQQQQQMSSATPRSKREFELLNGSQTKGHSSADANNPHPGAQFTLVSRKEQHFYLKNGITNQGHASQGSTVGHAPLTDGQQLERRTFGHHRAHHNQHHPLIPSQQQQHIMTSASQPLDSHNHLSTLAHDQYT